MGMNCPKCTGMAMQERQDSRNVTYDVCPGCRGLWLDAGELGQVLGQQTGEGSLLSPKPGPFPCPRCGGETEKGGLVSPMLVVERCKKCFGTWLDRGEIRVLRKLLGLGSKTEEHVPEAAKPDVPDAAKPGATEAPPAAALAGMIPDVASNPSAASSSASSETPSGLPTPKEDVYFLYGSGALVFVGVLALGFGAMSYRRSPAAAIVAISLGLLFLTIGSTILAKGKLPRLGPLLMRLGNTGRRPTGFFETRRTPWWDDPDIWD